MGLEGATRFSFKRHGNGEACLRDGWSRPEEEFTWSEGQESGLELPVPEAPGCLYVEFSLGAFACRPSHVRQRLAIAINGQETFAGSLEGNTSLGFLLPEAVARSAGKLHVRMHHPDAVTPKSLGLGGDDRHLAFVIREALYFRQRQLAPFSPILRGPLPISRITGDGREHELARFVSGLTLPDLLLAFECFGLNCEFGFVQRRCGAEPLSLLRFGGMSYAHLLIGLKDRFAELGNPGLLSCYVEQEGWDWMVANAHYGVSFHTLRMPSDIGADELLVEQARGLQFRREKFCEILATGEKLFVINRPEGMTEAEALPLLMRLRDFGPNALLYISATTGRPPGSVEALGPDLFRGAMDGVNRIAAPQERLGRDNWLSDTGLACWISVCAHAYRLWREHRGW